MLQKIYKDKYEYGITFDSRKDKYKDKDRDKDKDKDKDKMTKDPTCAIFSKMIWLKDIKYDDGRWTEDHDNDKDTRKDKDNDKDEMTKRPNMYQIFENDMTQGYEIK